MLLIRRAVPEDADAISKLIMGAAHHFLVDPCRKGAELFFASITPQAIRDYINDQRFHYLVADQDANLLGAVALRDGRHLFHLFVAPSHQRRGIASSLWDAARSAAAPDAMFLTVNASANAVAAYQRFGFTTVGPRQEVNGVAFTPMQAPADRSFQVAIEPALSVDGARYATTWDGRSHERDDTRSCSPVTKRAGACRRCGRFPAPGGRLPHRSAAASGGSGAATRLRRARRTPPPHARGARRARRCSGTGWGG